MKNKYFIKSLLLFGLVAAVFSFNSCKDDDENGGDKSKPVIKAVYLEDAQSSVPDRLVDFARLGQTIRLEGESFLGVNKLFINGFESLFNPALMTNTSMVVQISSRVPTIDAPDNVRNTIVLEKSGIDPCTYTFEIRAAAPSITSISHTMPQAGDRITVYGNGLQEITSVTFPGNVTVTDGIVSDDEKGTFFEVTVPAGVSNDGGSIFAAGANGGVYSPACFNYKKGLLHNFDDVDNYSWGSGVDNTALTALIPASGNGPKSQGGYQVFNSGGSLGAGADQRLWLNSSNAAFTDAMNTIAASTSADQCGIQMDIYVVGEWNSGIIRFSMADGYGASRYCMIYQPVYVASVYTPGAFVNPGCWFTVTLPFGSGADFAGKMFSDVTYEIGRAPYKQIGPWFENSGIKDIFDPVAATEKVYFDNIRVVPLTTPAYSDYPDE